MANLSQDDRAVIAKHPLDDSLDHLRDSLQKAEQSRRPGSTSDNSAGDIRDQDPLKIVSRLLSILQRHDVALTLRSKTGNENLAFELSTLFRRVQKNNFDYQQYRILSLLIIKKAPEFNVWNAAFDLIRFMIRILPSAAQG
jgi:hypothetical protein